MSRRRKDESSTITTTDGQPALTARPWELASCSRSSWYRAWSRGEIPDPVQTPGGRRWRVLDVLRWISNLKPAKRRTARKAAVDQPTAAPAAKK